MRRRGFVPLAAVLFVTFLPSPAYGRVTFKGDNVEAGDFFPLGSCDVVMLAESRHVYRPLAR
jgi:hypothetical protein